jgi:hypothetical protein
VAKKLGIDLKPFEPTPAAAVAKLAKAMKTAERKATKGKAKKTGKVAGKKRPRRG